MKKIKTTNGYTFLVDDEDYERVKKYNWYCAKLKKDYLSIQACKYTKGTKNKGCTTIRLSRYIMNVTDKTQIVDHINHDTLNNCKYNLRVCTTKENTRNKTSQKESSSKFLGVHKYEPKDRKNYTCFKAAIQINGKSMHLGTFKTENEAAVAYNNKATELFGQFANLNNI